MVGNIFLKKIMVENMYINTFLLNVVRERFSQKFILSFYTSWKGTMYLEAKLNLIPIPTATLNDRSGYFLAFEFAVFRCSLVAFSHFPISVAMARVLLVYSVEFFSFTTAIFLTSLDKSSNPSSHV